MLNRSQTAAVVVILASTLLGIFLLQNREDRNTGYILFKGQTMGTTWSVRLAEPLPEYTDLDELKTQIETRLRSINLEMSIYDPKSDISRFNQLQSSTPFAVPEDMFTVLKFSLKLAELTRGAFDPTVGPLVNLWGFGPNKQKRIQPTDMQIAEALQRVGYEHLSLTNDRKAVKDMPDLYLDLGAVAKGYGVDALTRLLIAGDMNDFLVEIGGETRAEGFSNQQTWRIGIQRPNFSAQPGIKLQGILHVSGMATATSGDYQNFHTTSEGKTFSHIIDPRTAQPVGHSVASVTVIAPDCMTADGWATALYVLGPEEGLAQVEKQPEIEALFVVRQPGNQFKEILSSAFSDVSGYEPIPLNTDK